MGNTIEPSNGQCLPIDHDHGVDSIYDQDQHYHTQTQSTPGDGEDHGAQCTPTPSQSKIAENRIAEAGMKAILSGMNDRGLPVVAPEVTTNDLKNLPVSEQAGETAGFGFFNSVSLLTLGFGVAATFGSETTMTSAAGTVGAIGSGVGTVLGAFKLGSDLRTAAEAPGEARDKAINQMIVQMTPVAMRLVNQKLGDETPAHNPYNGPANAAADRDLEAWKSDVHEKLDPLLKQLQALQMLPDQPAIKDKKEQTIKQIDQAMAESTVDLANRTLKLDVHFGLTSEDFNRERWGHEQYPHLNPTPKYVK